MAVYSSADSEAGYLRLADESICVGPGPSAQSYLSIPAIVAAAEIADVDAIHPGYGFLSENAHFAEICAASNIQVRRTRAGGDPHDGGQVAGARRGQEGRSRRGSRQQGHRGRGGPTRCASRTRSATRCSSKASAGGGGRGMRVAHNDMSLRTALQAARMEAKAAFGDGSVYLEKFLDRPRHVEVQVLADEHGHVVHLYERDCSVQRRHQKMLEESPCPSLPKDVRRKMHRAAVKLLKSIGYSSAGTVEFLVDKDNSYYFIEVNARIQVEHPVSEMVTGIGPGARAAARRGRREARLRPGRRAPEGRRDRGPRQRRGPRPRLPALAPDASRVGTRPAGRACGFDSHVHTGYAVPPNYDSMIGKLIVHAPDRRQAISRLARALDEFEVGGIRTTIRVPPPSARPRGIRGRPLRHRAGRGLPRRPGLSGSAVRSKERALPASSKTRQCLGSQPPFDHPGLRSRRRQPLNLEEL